MQLKFTDLEQDLEAPTSRKPTSKLDHVLLSFNSRIASHASFQKAAKTRTKAKKNRYKIRKYSAFLNNVSLAFLTRMSQCL